LKFNKIKAAKYPIKATPLDRRFMQSRSQSSSPERKQFSALVQAVRYPLWVKGL